MDIRQVTPAYSVSPQIQASDLAEIAKLGFKTVLCNRPDIEVGPDEQAAAIRTATEAAGLSFVENPIQNGAMTEENVALQMQTLAEAEGPILGYCRSGTRSTVAWMFGSAPTTPAAQLVQTAADAGYDLAGLQPQLDAMFSG